jgi:hypothetical protein
MGSWIFVWAGIQSGDVSDAFHPEFSSVFLNGVRAILPLVAAGIAIVKIALQLSSRKVGSRGVISPLSLLAIYGVIGVLAIPISPDWSVALYWVALYLSVPLVLWAATWGPNSLEAISRIIRVNWTIVIAIFVGLFAFGLLNLDLKEALSHPGDLVGCPNIGSWVSESSGVIRSSGVARFAAITGIIALTLGWKGNGFLRVVWFTVLLGAVVLILTTGSRGSLIAMLAGLPVVALLLGGKKTAFTIVGILVVLAPLAWTTNAHDTFLNGCILRSWTPGSLPFAVQNPHGIPSQPLEEISESTSGPISASSIPSDSQPNDLKSPEAGLIPRGFFTLTGRTQIWNASWVYVKASPIFGYGFQGDRLVLGTHIHNAGMQALFQTGFIGLIPFVAGVLLGWVFLVRLLRRINHLAEAHRILTIQAAGIFVFLTIRAIPESTGAFFGIDFILLGPILVFLYAMDRNTPRSGING